MVLFLYKSVVVLIVISSKWGLFGIINQIYHASVGILMECLPSGRWFSLGLRPRGKPSSLGETFHQDTHTGMAIYLYNVLSSSPLSMPKSHANGNYIYIPLVKISSILMNIPPLYCWYISNTRATMNNFIREFCHCQSFILFTFELA